MNIPSLDRLFENQLRDIYSAEQQFAKALPRLAKGVKSMGLRETLMGQVDETKRQLDRLDRIGRTLNIKLTGKKCIAIQGLLEEVKEVMDAQAPQTLKDVALIAATQKVEHYQISAYGSARTVAEHMGNSEVARDLQATLDEESAADHKLTQVSMQEVLPASQQAATEEMEESAPRSRKVQQKTGMKKKASSGRGDRR
jgi:ferritin-like metal-binding protein YciE